MSGSAYELMVHMTFAGNAAQYLSALSSQLLGVHSSVRDIENNFTRWGQAITGVGAIMAGTALAAGMVKIANHGDELLKQQNLLIQAGVDHQKVAEMTADAYERITKMVPTATGADVLRVANELRYVKGSLEDAMAAVPQALKLESVLGNSTGKNAEGAGYNIWRALELKNVTMDKAHTDKLMGTIVSAMIATGGKVNANEVLQFAKQAGVSWASASDSFVAGPMTSLIQEMGGARAGTAHASIYQLVSGATSMSIAQRDKYEELGLLNLDKVEANGHGRFIMHPGFLKDQALAMSNFYEWSGTVLKKALIEHGVPNMDLNPLFQPDQTQINDLADNASVAKAMGIEGDQTQRRQQMAKLYPNRMAAREAEIYMDPASRLRIDKDSALNRQAQGLDLAYGGALAAGANMTDTAYAKQYESMMQAIGAPLKLALIPVMQDLTAMFNKIGAIAAAHPEAIQMIGTAIMGISAGLVGLGTVLLGSAVVGMVGTLPLIAAGLTGVAAAFGLLYATGVFGSSAAATAANLKNSASGGFMYDHSADASVQTVPHGPTPPPSSESAGKQFADKLTAQFVAAMNPSAATIASINASLQPYSLAISGFLKQMGSNMGASIQSALASLGTSISGMASSIGSSISTFASSIGSKMSAAIASIPGMVMGAISGMASSIGSSISNAIKSLGGLVGGNGASMQANPGRLGGGYHPMNYVPPSGGRTSLTVAVNSILDGRRVAQSVSKQIVMGARSVGGAARFDGTLMPPPVDLAFA